MGERRDYLHSVGQIADMLGARAHELCVDLLPGGRVEGHEYVCGGLDGGDGRSMKVHLGGSRPGVWADFAADEKGDALDLVALSLFRGSGRAKVDAIKWARKWLGLDGTDPATLKRSREAQAKAAQAAEKADEEIEAKRRSAVAKYRAGRDIEGTPVEAYLRGRGIDVGRFDSLGALKYLANLDNRESGRAWPAMVASIIDPMTGRQVALHRTWLQLHPDGQVTKAPLKDAKMSLGPLKGGIISLSKGRNIDPATGEVTRGQPLSKCKKPVRLHLTEGIEDGLTVALAALDERVAAAVSLGNMLSLRFPPLVAEIVMHRQNDPPGSKAAVLFDKVCARFVGMGLRVRVAKPPEGVKDVNDLVREARKEAVA